MKLIMESWRRHLNEDKLRVFDFDDTLAQTDAKIVLHKASGETLEQTPGEWAIYKPEPGDEFNYEQFQGGLKNPREIKNYTNIMRNMLAAGSEGRKTAILTARADPSGIPEFLEDIGIDSSALEIVALGESDPQAKADWIEARIAEGYDDIFFIDDSEKNVTAVQALQDKHPNIKMKARLV